MLRIERLEVMIDDHGKELTSLMYRVAAVEKVDGGCEGSSVVDANIAYLKKEVAALQSIDLSTFGMDKRIYPKWMMC